ncbi:MAG: CDP-diacylglycerol--glycerol-3-phosphate 3-phosphatidyltransferase [Clostridiales bacterium]|jgi:CDP-diacylglycerol--glycerol-3-phosphate 3-phosphatidyltransferase|nr:CDP-diacylglycerol--glycerol-3-phosphate 3-phosphatidyltransferase [Clostridiales bacterium]
MNVPNAITTVRIILVPVVCVFYLLGFAYSQLIATGIFILAAFTDFLDGHVARKYNLVTDLGKFLDLVADKVLIISVFFLLTYQSPDEFRLYFLIGALLVNARELIIGAFRQVAAGKSVILAADRLGKLKMLMQCVSVPILMAAAQLTELLNISVNYFYIPGLALFGVSVILAVVSGVNYIAKNKRVFAAKDN